MAITSTWCPVVGTTVTRVTDLEGRVMRVICAEYEASTNTCRLKRSAFDEGPLSQLLERVSEDTLKTRSTLCEFSAG